MSWTRRLLPGPVGCQEPRIHIRPDADDWGRGDDVLWWVEQLRTAEGFPAVELMPWQELIVSQTFAMKDDLWAASDLGVIVARQNGKGGVLEVLALAHCLLFDARRILWTAQLQKTSDDAHARMAGLINSCPDLKAELDDSRQDGGITYGSGMKTIRFRNGASIVFFTRGPNAGRGLFADVVIFDEAYDLTPEEVAALAPTLKTAENAQLIYTSTPPDEEVHPHGKKLAKVRKNALEGEEAAKKTAWMEWGVPSLEDLTQAAEKEGRKLLEDPRTYGREFWSMANPSMGYLFTEDTVLADVGRLGLRKFQVEDLCVPDFWPDPDEEDADQIPISRTAWELAGDSLGVLLDPVAIGLDMSPDRRVAIVAAGHREDGRAGIETIVHGQVGAERVVDVLLELIDSETAPAVLVIDGGSPAGSLLPRLRAAGIEPLVIGAREMSQACESLADDVQPSTDRIRHRGNDAPLNQAVEVARWRPLGTEGALAFARKGHGDISPLVAAALAAFGLHAFVAAGGPKKAPAAPVVVSGSDHGGWAAGEIDFANVGF